MNTPFAHAHVSHITKTRRRRSRSLTELNSGRTGFSKQKQHGDDLHPSLSTENRRTKHALQSGKYASSTMLIFASAKKDIPTKTGKSLVLQQSEPYQPAVIRVPLPTAVLSTRSGARNNETPSLNVGNDHMQEEEQPSQITRIPRPESAKSIEKQSSTELNKVSHVQSFLTIKNPNTNSPTDAKDLCLNLSEASSYPLITTSSNRVVNSELFDQEFSLTDNKSHPENDIRNRGIIKTKERENHYITEIQNPSSKSSTSLMTAIIAIVIAILAFILALTAFILVISLRSTVYNSLGTNSTTSDSSSSGSSGSTGSLPSSCSAYTTLNDPTRNVYAAGYALGCDNSAPFTNRTSPIWIRFIGTGGTMLPLTTVGVNQCGSTGTGWYSGTMPSSTGQIVNGTACFTFTYSVCQYSSSISVANCGSFYIYLLPPPPTCMARYCTI